jgi:hypothetical protein
MVFLLGGACEDQITPELAIAPPFIIIDAFITDQDSIQTIRITQSQAYFDNSVLQAVTGATVKVLNSKGSVYNFDQSVDGFYQWDPSGSNSIATEGDSLTLQVNIGADQYQAISVMGRVPEIDSVTFRFEEENLFLPDSYFAEFWSRDFLGPGDTYWIKSYKNGVYLNQPNEINIAFDAGFSEGGNVDGLIFIPPIRDFVNPFEEDHEGQFMSPFEDGDSIFVEIYSITNETFFFLNEVRIQTDRPGGFAELFATPLSNVPTNILYLGSKEQVVVAGFFNIAAVKGAGKKLDITQIPKGN